MIQTCSILCNRISSSLPFCAIICLYHQFSSAQRCALPLHVRCHLCFFCASNSLQYILYHTQETYCTGFGKCNCRVDDLDIYLSDSKLEKLAASFKTPIGGWEVLFWKKCKLNCSVKLKYIPTNTNTILMTAGMLTRYNALVGFLAADNIIHM